VAGWARRPGAGWHIGWNARKPEGYKAGKPVIAHGS